MLTDDGDLALRLTHPRYALPKVYEALVAAEPPRAALDQLRRGMDITGGRAADGASAGAGPGRGFGGGTWIEVEIHEGRNRQVRRMLEEVGYPVLRLRRVRVGPLALGSLRPGAWRMLTTDEVAALRRAARAGV